MSRKLEILAGAVIVVLIVLAVLGELFGAPGDIPTVVIVAATAALIALGYAAGTWLEAKRRDQSPTRWTSRER